MNPSDVKIALISPPQTHLSDPSRAEPLGLMYMEGVLRNMGFDVELADMSFDSVLPAADIYGFSASTVNFSQVLVYTRQVGEAYTIIGGPHVSALPLDASRFFDAVVMGPGEYAIQNVLNDFAKGLRGYIYRKAIADIDTIPIPPRPIWNRIRYGSFEDARGTASIITSRGCPFQCAFCASNAVWGRHVHYRSVDNVVKEIQYLKESYEIGCFKFVDDIFTLNKARFKVFSDVLSTLNIKWFCETRVDSIDDAVLDQMVKSGCTTINLGVESVDDLVLEKIQKKQNADMIRKAVERIHSKGLRVKMYLIYGLPFEPSDIVQRTKAFIEETSPEYVSLFTFTPYPGTDIWNDPDKYNIKTIDKDFDRYQHSLGEKEAEQNWLPSIEYHNRTREMMRDERNELKRFTMDWNMKRKNHD